MGGNTRRLGSLGATLEASQHSLSLFLLEHKLWYTTEIPAGHLTPGCCSVTKSCPTLQPHGLQHARLPCPSPSPRVCSNSCH